MKEFMRCHPVVNLIYYIGVIAFGVTLMHPVYLLVGLLGSVFVLVATSGFKSTAKTGAFALAIALITAVFNVLFNHQGVTVLLYFPNGNVMTLESLAFGVASGVMLSTVIMWFMSLNKIITSEKIIYLFGGIFPGISLMISMILRFVPEYIENFRKIRKSRQAIGKGNENKFIMLKKTFTAFLTQVLENGIKTSDSMRARLFGNARRTSFSNYKFTKRDGILTGCVLIFEIVTLCGVLAGDAKAVYFPETAFNKTDLLTVISYILLCVLPLIFEFAEGQRWKRLK